MKRTQVLFQGIEPTIKAEFKSACAKRGKSMKSVLIEYMQYYIAHAPTMNKQKPSWPGAL